MNKTEHVFETISSEIGEGRLKPGDKLMSVRNASEDMRVSKNTIIEAYDRLVAKGLITAKRGSGYYISERRVPISEINLPPPRHVSEATDRVSLLQAQLKSDFSIRVGDGRPPASWMEGMMLGLTKRQISQSNGEDSTGYGSHYGHLELRQLIAARNRSQNIQIDESQIVTTFGANHGLDLIIRRYLAPGDTVLVDDPGYYPLFAKLELAQVRFVGVRRTPKGPDLDDFKKKVKREKPVFFFTQSTGQNPTGSSIDLPTAHSLLQTANQAGVIIVDDDPFADLPNANSIRLAALDQFQSMIFVGSFSKVVSASFRTGYIVAPPNIAAEIAETKLITAVNSSRFSEIMIAQMMKSRRYHKHLQKLNSRLDTMKSAYLSRVKKFDLNLFTTDIHGYYSYLILPDATSDLDLAAHAAQLGIFIAPSTPFNTQLNTGTSAIRINITRADDIRFFTFIEKYLKKTLSN